MTRAVRIIFPLTVGLFAMSAIAMVVLVRHRHAAERATFSLGAGLTAGPRPDFSGLTIPTFDLIDQDRRPFSRRSLEGRFTILDVVFTNCPMACPMMTEKMNGLAESLADLPSVQLVSLSIDPRRDTPERLRDYMKLHDIDPVSPQARQWHFLTDPSGSDTPARSIVVNGLKAVLEDDRSLPIKASDGTDMFNIRHPTWFFLIGPDAAVIDIYQSSADEAMKRLAADVRRRVGAANTQVGER